MDKIYYNKSLKPRAQELRRETTPQENHLWYDFLRSYPHQFRRQKQFARYIVDFYCSDAKLVIEVDGAQHMTQDGREHDHARTCYLESLGLSVMRYTNAEVERQFAAVCAEIDEAVKRRAEAIGGALST